MANSPPSPELWLRHCVCVCVCGYVRNIDMNEVTLIPMYESCTQSFKAPCLAINGNGLRLALDSFFGKRLISVLKKDQNENAETKWFKQ